MTGRRLPWPPGRTWWVTPHHTRWLVACVSVMLVAVWAGGASFAVVLVFVAIFASGAALIALDSTAVMPHPDGSAHDVVDEAELPVRSGVTPNDGTSRA